MISLSLQLALEILSPSCECWDYRTAAKPIWLYLGRGDPNLGPNAYGGALLDEASPQAKILVFIPTKLRRCWKWWYVCVVCVMSVYVI